MKLYKPANDLTGSHLPLLVHIFDVSEGDVLELGTGLYSTPVLHWLANMRQRHLFSCENDPEWIEPLQKYESEYHHIVPVTDYAETARQFRPHGGRWGLVFIDCVPNRWRRWNLAYYADRADYLVAHDAEIESQGNFHLERTLQTFKYRYDYRKLMPATTVVSNVKDLSWLSNFPS